MAFNCDQWMQKALAELDDGLPASHEPMLTAQANEDWLVWREMSQRQIRASGETLGVQHNLRLTLSCTAQTDHQVLAWHIQEAIKDTKGCVYVRSAGDQWNQETRRRECTLYVGIMEAV